MKPFEYYSRNPLDYPSKETYTTTFVYSKGAVVWSGPNEDYRTRAKADVFKGMLVEHVVDEAALKAARQAYGAEASRLEQEFKADLFEANGVTGHPKANKCFAIAYDYGHHSGHREMASHFETFVDLIKD